MAPTKSPVLPPFILGGAKYELQVTPGMGHH